MFESASALGIDWIGRDRIGPILDLLEAGHCADLRNRSVEYGLNMVAQVADRNPLFGGAWL
jgi:hypothetical protein